MKTFNDINNKQEAVNEAVNRYLAAKDMGLPAHQLLKIEQEIISSLFYMINKIARKYRNSASYEDLMLTGYESIAMALKTFDPSQHPSFAYWADLYCKRINKQAFKSIHQDQAIKEFFNGPSVFDANRKISQEQKCIIQQAIDALSEHDFVILKEYIYSTDMAQMARKRNISRQAMHMQVKRIINKIKL